ncbi:hypothetical protein ABE10_01695, partial [Bacillus toyonensis]|nr:hypothetical protein [Bacillus toyonensis]
MDEQKSQPTDALGNGDADIRLRHRRKQALSEHLSYCGGHGDGESEGGKHHRRRSLRSERRHQAEPEGQQVHEDQRHPEGGKRGTDGRKRLQQRAQTSR